MTNNIRKIREMAGISQAELGKHVNMSQQQIDLLEKDKRQLKITQLEDIANVLGVPPYQLVDSDKWNPHRNTPTTPKLNEAEKIYSQTPNLDTAQYVTVPLYDITAAAGPGYEISKEYTEAIKPLVFELPYLRRLGKYEEIFGMFIEGTSMEPVLPDKSLILVDKSKKELWQGKIYLARLSYMLYVKYIEVRPDKIILKSANPDKELYPNIDIPTNGIDGPDFQILGRVIWYSSET